MTDQVTTDRTRISGPTVDAAPLSRTRTIDELLEETGFLRNQTRLLGDDVAETHRKFGEVYHRAFEAQLDSRARERAKRPAPELLDELASEGFAWRDIARLVGVSVPAVRKWRQGESPNGSHLLAIARLCAFVETLKVDHLVTDVASWMEMPLTPDVPITGIDAAAEGRYGELLDVAANHSTAEELLDCFLPDWRSRYRSDVEVFEAADGELAIRLTSPETA